MIHSASTQAKQPFLRILTQDQIFEIRRAAFDIMFSVGFKVLHDGAREMLKKAGAVVEGERVRVPEFIVKQCLVTAPNGFTLYDRLGNRALEVEGRKSYYGTSTGSPRTKDARTGTTFVKNTERKVRQCTNELETVQNELSQTKNE